VVFFGLVVGSLIGLVAGQAAAGGPPSAEPPTSLIGIFIGVVMVFYVLAIVSAQAITGARIPNAVWNGTRLAGVWFTSSLNSWRLFRIMLTNLLATVLTLGLFRPFAQVRLARYFAGCMTMAHVSGLDGFVAAESEDVAAVGEETAELFDLDIGF
jgi:uncharacterized membrane protein YjgN (DUF898 family)